MITPNYTSLDGRIRFYNCDCMDLMNCGKVWDLAVVDPPYGINVNVSMGRRKGNKKSDYHKFSGNDSSIPNENYFKELFRISKNQIVWGGNYMTEFLKPSPCWILWDKGFSENVTFAQFEMAWSSFSSSAKKYDFNAAANKDRIHPTQKPTDLYRWILKNYAKAGDTILDTHGGSMSSAIACHMEGFELDICELDKEYFDAAVNRFKIYEQQQKLF